MRRFGLGTLVCDEGVLMGHGMVVHPDGSVAFGEAPFVDGSRPGLKVWSFLTHVSTVTAWAGRERISGTGADHWPCPAGCV
jgi:hypothetical protein